jgi:hypothetical protein
MDKLMDRAENNFIELKEKNSLRLCDLAVKNSKVANAFNHGVSQ